MKWGVTLRPSGYPDPTIREAPGERTETGDHPGYRLDSLSRKYPCDEFGHRIVAGSRRPKGIPPDVWKCLNSKEKATLFLKAALMKDKQHPLRMVLEHLLVMELRRWVCLTTIRSPNALRLFRSGSGASMSIETW